ncbi:putative MFS family arabinose efflux permease [Paenibacillus forsythiae]|uniref:MFS family arabinose efflux permease n=1 Tax=Paenibacillus forsythiae TaxID=365616 RepID=A0ABU3H4W0_9BACL|nr:MFS transporter [Paenibacillus forsythiae]MDT3424740.1 putative MFS family arabinose efflux permease [Paenibacillus forsythiae]
MSKESNRSNLALLALAISAFAIGTTEFISVGLLPLIAEDFNISVTLTGLTVTLYALGVTFGAPILTSLTSGVPKKTLLAGIMLVFIAGNTLAAFSGGITLLLIARVVSSLSHGVFMSIGSTIAADLVPEDQRASAIAIMFSGLTVATVTGVPIGTFIGQQLGWRAAFITIVIIGAVAFIANMILVPPNLRKGSKTPLREQVKLVTNGRLLLAFLITALGYGGTFVVFTYLSPLLHDIMGLAQSTVALVLLLYGIAIAIGNVIGGKAANRNPLSALLRMFILQALVLLVLTFTAPFKILGLITIFGMGLLAFMNVPGLQIYVVTLAERYAPKAVDVASAVNIAAFNAGIALGAYLGGIIADTLGLIHTAWIGALMVTAAVVLTAWSLVLERNKNASPETEAAL